MKRSIIAAFAVSNRALGHQGRLPWHLPDDLARFKRLTMGHPVIMGRLTFNSLEGRKLAGRQMIVVSRQLDALPANAQAVSDSLQGALSLAADRYEATEAFVAGGGQLYAAALAADAVDAMYLTLVEADVPADVFFPQFDSDDWIEIHRHRHDADEDHAYAFTYSSLIRSR